MSILIIRHGLAPCEVVAVAGHRLGAHIHIRPLQTVTHIYGLQAGRSFLLGHGIHRHRALARPARDGCGGSHGEDVDSDVQREELPGGKGLIADAVSGRSLVGDDGEQLAVDSLRRNDGCTVVTNGDGGGRAGSLTNGPRRLIERNSGFHIQNTHAVDAADTGAGCDIYIEFRHLVREGEVDGLGLFGLVRDGSKHQVACLVGHIGGLVGGHGERRASRGGVVGHDVNVL